LNNPLKYVDPYGLSWWNPFSWGDWGGFFESIGDFFTDTIPDFFESSWNWIKGDLFVTNEKLGELDRVNWDILRKSEGKVNVIALGIGIHGAKKIEKLQKQGYVVSLYGGNPFALPFIHERFEGLLYQIKGAGLTIAELRGHSLGSMYGLWSALNTGVKVEKYISIGSPLTPLWGGFGASNIGNWVNIWSALDPISWPSVTTAPWSNLDYMWSFPPHTHYGREWPRRNLRN